MTSIPPKAEKLLRLALDDAACQGEWETAARMLIASLRKAGCKAESLLAPPLRNPFPQPSQSYRKPEPPPWKSKATHKVNRMPFGMHKGKTFRELPNDYLGWLATLPDLKPELLKAVKFEIKRRAKI